MATNENPTTTLYRDDLFLEEFAVKALHLHPKDLLHFSIDGQGNLHIRKADLKDQNYSLIFDSDFNVVVPREIMQEIQARMGSLDTTLELETEIAGDEIILRCS